MIYISPRYVLGGLGLMTKIGGGDGRVNYTTNHLLNFYMGKVVETHINGSRILSQGQAPIIVNIYSGSFKLDKKSILSSFIKVQSFTFQ